MQTATQATPTRSPDSPAISKFARRHIERKARQLIRRVDGNLCDKEDLVQELTLILLERLPQFNPQRGHSNVYVVTVLERSAATIFNFHRADKRNWEMCAGSLYALIAVDREAPDRLSDTLVEEHRRRHRRVVGTNSFDQVDLAHDVAKVEATLPPHLRDLCERLKRDSIAEIARETGIPRTTLNDWVRMLREIFEAHGLGD